MYIYILPLEFTTQTFRILDGKDGKVDGVLSIVKGAPHPSMGRSDITSQAKDALTEGGK